MTLPFHVPLSADQQIAFGIDAPQPLAMADIVRFSELDILNHANNVAYMEWFERLRIKYAQIWGLNPYDGSSSPLRIVIRSGEIRYLQELRMDDVYVATCRCAAFRTTSYTLEQQLWSNATLRATYSCVLVLLSPDGTQRMPIPGPVRDRFIDVDGATPDA